VTGEVDTLKKDWAPYLVYGVLALAILGCLLLPGYVLTLDLNFSPTPHYSRYFWGLSEWSTSVYGAGIASNPFFFIVQLLAKIIPMWVTEKFILFLILFLSGLGAHRLISKKSPGCYYAGILYMINPFVYSRFMAGQWGVLWAYAWLLIAIGVFIKLLREGNWKNTVKMAVLATLAGLLQVQGFFILLVACSIILFIKIILDRSKTSVFESLKWSGAAAGIFFVLNLYWLIPLFTSTGTTLNQLNQADQLAFSSGNTAEPGILFNILSMHGFWRESYTYAKDILPFWWILFLIILFLAIYGFISKVFPPSRPAGTKPNEKEALPEGSEEAKRTQTSRLWLPISFAVIGATGFILALGVATDYTRPFFEWLWNSIPFFRVFRDSQRFVALLCLSYAYSGGLGINELAGTLKQRMRRPLKTGMIILIILFLLTPLIYSFTMFNFHGQLGVTDYPEEWYEVNDYLNKDSNDFNMLFLPWHMYMDFNWLPNTDKRLLNPSQQFFDKPVIAGDNIEILNIYSQSPDPISKYVEFILSRGSEINNLGELLAPLNVKYIILVNEADYVSYDFLYRQEDLKVETQKSGITLFKNEHPTSKAYAVNSVVHIDNLDEYLELSKKQDVMDHVYVFGEGSQEQGNGQMESLECREKSPVKYQVNGTSNLYTVFTVPQNVNTNNWEYNGQGPILQNLGLMPAFVSSPEGGKIIYTRFCFVYLPNYIISLVFLLVILYSLLPGYLKPHIRLTGRKPQAKR
jgi:hypothetical protein